MWGQRFDSSEHLAHRIAELPGAVGDAGLGRVADLEIAPQLVAQFRAGNGPATGHTSTSRIQRNMRAANHSRGFRECAPGTMSGVEGVLRVPCHPSRSRARPVEVRSETFDPESQKVLVEERCNHERMIRKPRVLDYPIDLGLTGKCGTSNLPALIASTLGRVDLRA